MLIIPGERVCPIDDHIYSHNTYPHDAHICASVLGTRMQIDKLVMLRPLNHFRYIPLAGDVVVGRVSALCSRRWRVDCNAQTECMLGLSAIALPMNMQRRRAEEDEMAMQTYYDVGDLLVAVVQKMGTGMAMLSTRNERCGKLTDGLLVEVRPDCIGSYRSSFAENEWVCVVIGANGYVCVRPKTAKSDCLVKVASVVQYLEACARDKKVVDDQYMLSL